MITNMRAYFVIIILVCFSFSFIYSQKNAEKGDRYFDQNQFGTAIKYYLLDIKSGDRKTSEHAMRRLADCYRIIGEFEKAEETYKKILKRKKKDPTNYLNYGLSLKSSAKYAEAKVQFNEYILLKPEDPMGKMLLISCDSAQKWLDETIGREVKNIDKINTEHSEFSPVLLSDSRLYFASSRTGSKEALISFDGGGDMHRLDLYSISMDLINEKENRKTDIINFKDINSPMHDGSACFSKDGKELYFTKTVKGKRNLNTNDILFTLQVYYCKIDSTGRWSKPESAFSFNSMDYSVGHPALSDDEQTIYFMSDKPGGYGKTDIYYSIKQKNGEWGKPVNAGNFVNTFGYELFPYYSETGKLYFSSNAHPGMGQLDIFYAEYMDAKWVNVQNMKPPINSIGNDFGIALDGAYNRGFLSSDRFNGRGAEDIYSFSDEIPISLTLKQSSIEFFDKSIYDDIKYKLINERDKSELELTAKNGLYSFDLRDKEPYLLIAKKSGFPFNKINLELIRDTISGDFSIKIKPTLKPLTIDGYYLPVENKVKQENGMNVYFIPLAAVEKQVKLDLNSKGYFKCDQELDANSEYIITSKSQNP